jgi:hypothetical protein
MSPAPNELLRDPLFQLNSVLWLAQPMPTGADIEPLLYNGGHTVYAIAPPLTVPLDLRLTAREAPLKLQDSVRPDVVLKRVADARFSFVECKANSFGSASSATEQCRSLLAVAGARAAEVLGLPLEQVSTSMLLYVVPEHCQQPLEETLGYLQSELRNARLPASESLPVGLSATDGAINLVVGEAAGGFLGLAVGVTPFLHHAVDDDPRPLYFIPYDPDIDQTPTERTFSRRLLFERILSTLVAAVGHATPPTQLPFTPAGVLNDATFGMFAQWENRNSARHMTRLWREFALAVSAALNATTAGAATMSEAKTLTLSLADVTRAEEIHDTLLAFSCESLSIQPPPESTLFDGVPEAPTDGSPGDSADHS